MNTCPDCGGELNFIRINEDPAGGWYQCDSGHQWRRTPAGGWVALAD